MARQMIPAHLSQDRPHLLFTSRLLAPSRRPSPRHALASERAAKLKEACAQKWKPVPHEKTRETAGPSASAGDHGDGEAWDLCSFLQCQEMKGLIGPVYNLAGSATRCF
ncbi:unnamed protein product [Lota lota]